MSENVKWRRLDMKKKFWVQWKKMLTKANFEIKQ